MKDRPYSKSEVTLVLSLDSARKIHILSLKIQTTSLMVNMSVVKQLSKWKTTTARTVRAPLKAARIHKPNSLLSHQLHFKPTDQHDKHLLSPHRLTTAWPIQSKTYAVNLSDSNGVLMNGNIPLPFHKSLRWQGDICAWCTHTVKVRGSHFQKEFVPPHQSLIGFHEQHICVFFTATALSPYSGGCV